MRTLFPVLVVLCLSGQESLDQKRDRLAPKVEEARGLKYAKPVPLREGTRKQFSQAALDSAHAVYGEDLDAAGRCLKALGLLSQTVSLKLAITAGATLGPKALYVNSEILVLDAGLDDATLVYRMILALTDQKFPEAELRKSAAGNLDAQLAITGLRSGDAELSKNLFVYGKLPEDFLAKQIEDADKWEQGESRIGSSFVPRLFVRLGDYSWRRGGIFIETLRRKGGMDQVNKAHEKPPRSTSQILHPQKYIDGWTPVTLDLAPVEEYMKGQGYGLAYKTTFGELGLAIFLETHFKKEDVREGSTGWAGDTLLYFEGNGQGVVVWATEWESEKEATAAHAWLQKAANKLFPKDGRLNTVVRRKTSLAFVEFTPRDLMESIFDKLWKCKRKGKKEDLYGTE